MKNVMPHGVSPLLNAQTERKAHGHHDQNNRRTRVQNGCRPFGGR